MNNTITPLPTAQNLLEFLKAQEPDHGSEASRYHFSGRFVATPAAIEAHGIERILACLCCLRQQAALHGGLDYLQVFTFPGQRLWFIDDETHVTALLPSDY